MDARDVKRLFAYNEWANARVLDAVAPLTADQFTRDLASSFPSIRDTLSHVIAVEWVWLQRWKGTSPSAAPEWSASADPAVFGAQLRAIAADRAAFFAELTDADLARRIAYTNFTGERWEYALGDMLLHLVNHSTYHRGQLTTMLRQVGAAAPATDFLIYDDVQGAG